MRRSTNGCTPESSSHTTWKWSPAPTWSAWWWCGISMAAPWRRTTLPSRYHGGSPGAPEDFMAVLIDAIDVKRRTLFEFDNTPFSCLEAEVNTRSEERRVGKERRSPLSPGH